jgi:tetratricopeptide (TPR) repeat protein
VDAEQRTADQAKYDGPPIPDDITGQELDRSVLAQLRGLPEKLAARVARHLVAAGRLLDDDPETAYQHTLAARARAARVAVVREAVGEAAYAAGHFAEALSELRAARRMNGANDYLFVMADCERAIGRPERALELARNPAVAKLPVDQRTEMTIVEAGARFDLGEVEGALRTLENAPLKAETRADWVVRLRYAYADLLLQAGRREQAVEWFHRTAGIDGSGVTDAAERIEELEQRPDAGRRAGSDAQD